MVAGAALIAVAAPVLAVAGAAVALPAIGFGTGGVIGGSLAAAIQSAVYGGSTCGLFSVFQAAGATIVAPSVSSVLGATTATVVGGKLIAGASAEYEAEEQDGSPASNAVDGRTTDAARCPCVECVCTVDCECDCRRGRA
ncbi:hypothetical protein OH76DRAFT_1236254 [Lentinus brumalis]|uniref:Uncharacterized protein n=1 Tax=Lentinus brumalis TaxID=2498619 RepID=A0A371CSC6_9APHY|nr:hypothetical protein OH76DRAFT_1236254 [Polyporus brumalis]